jgi:WD40 repeat protein
MTRHFLALGLLLTISANLFAAPVPVVPPDATKDRDGNPLPKGATARLGFAGLRAKQGYGISFSPDGKTIATANDTEVLSWDCQTGRALPTKAFAPADKSLKGGNIFVAGDRVFMLAFQPFVPGMREPVGSVVVLNRDTGREIANIPSRGSVNFAPYCFPPRLPPASVSQDGRYLAMVSRPEKVIEVYDADTGKRLHSQKLDNPYMAGSLISPDNKTLYIHEPAKPIRRCELVSGKALPDLDGTDRSTDLLDASPDGKLVVTRGSRLVKDAVGNPQSVVSEDFLMVRDAVGNETLGRLELGARAQLFAFSGNEAVIVVTGAYRPPGPPIMLMSRWNVTTRKRQWEVPVAQSIHSLAVSPDGKRVALFNRGQIIDLFDPATGKRLSENPGHSGAVRWLAFSPDGQTVTTVGESEAIVWSLKGEAKSTTELTELRRGNMQSWLFGDRLAWATFADDGKTAELAGWDQEKNRIAWRLPLGTEAPERTFSHDGKQVVGIRADEKTKKVVVTVYDGPLGKKKHEWDLPGASYQGPYSFPPLALSGDGKLLFVASDGIVGRDVTTG